MKTPNKNVIALIAAVVMALVCALLLKVLIDRKISNSLHTDTVSYVVANADLSNGMIIDPFDDSAFAVRSDIPASLAQSNAITPDQADAIEGALLIADMKRGDILTWQMVDTDGRRQLASRLQAGRRALAIPVDDQSSIASMLKPNDHIDLILSYDRMGMVVAAPLLQNVRVIATGDKVNTHHVYSDESSGNYTNITLDLSIEDVSRVTMALDIGRISAVLRNPDDTSFTENIISLETLQQAWRLRTVDNAPPPVPSYDYPEVMEPPPAAPPTPSPSIQVIYGNQKNKAEQS